MQEKVILPDGSYVMIPDNFPPESRAEFDRQVALQFPPSQPQGGTGRYGEDLMYGSGIGSLDQSPTGEPTDYEPVGEGTNLGALYEGLKSVPRGLRQFGLMAQQGFEGLRSIDEDTDREKELRERMHNLMMEIDPRYRDSNAVNVGMGLGQVAGMMGLGAAATLGGAAVGLGAGASAIASGVVAGTSTALMGAGEQTSRIAEFEERTGQDVSAEKEKMALAMGLGIGLSEIAPLGKFAKGLGIARKSGAKLSQQLVDQAADMTTGKMMKSMMRQAVEEAAQEGTAGFAQSATARYLYDEDAMATAGADAFREALVGGQVGAVTDLLIKSLTRSIGNKRSRGGDYYLNKILSDEQKTLLAEGKLKGSTAVSNLISGATMTEKEKSAELAARVDDKADAFTEADALKELNRYKLTLEFRDSIITTDEAGNIVANEEEGSLWKFAKDKHDATMAELLAGKESGKYDEGQYNALRDAEMTSHGNEIREQAIMIAGFKAQAEGTLRDPSQEQAESEQKEIDEIVDTVDAQNSEQTKRKFIKQNEESPNQNLTEETAAPEQKFSTKALEEILESHLAPSNTDLENEADEQNQKEVNEAGFQLDPLTAKEKQLTETIEGAKKNLRTRDLTGEQEARFEQLKADREVVENGTAAMSSGQGSINDQLIALDAQLKAGSITQEDHASEAGRLTEALAMEEQTPIQEQATTATGFNVDLSGNVTGVEQLGIRQLEADPEVTDENLTTRILKGAIKKKEGTLKQAWKKGTKNRDGSVRRRPFTLAEVQSLIEKRKLLKTLKKKRRDIARDIDLLRPEDKISSLTVELKDVQAQKKLLMGKEGDSVEMHEVSESDLAKRGVEPYARQLKQQREDKKSSLKGEATSQGLRGDAYRLYVSDGMMRLNEELDQRKVRVLRSGFRALMSEQNQETRRTNLFLEKQQANNIKLNTPAEGRQKGMEDKHARYQLEQRLRTPEQRQAYQDFVARLDQNGDESISPQETQKILKDILSGGKLGGLLLRTSGVGLSLEKVSSTQRTSGVTKSTFVSDSQLQAPVKGERTQKYTKGGTEISQQAGRGERAAGNQAAEDAMKSLQGILSVVAISKVLDETAHDKPAPEHWIGVSMGKLANNKIQTLKKRLEKKRFKIEIADIEKLLRIKNFNVPKNLTKTKFFKQMVSDTLGEPKAWNKLDNTQQQSVFARILETKDQPDNTETGKVETLKKKRANKKVKDSDTASVKPQVQIIQQTKNLIEANKRVEIFKAAILKAFQKAGLADIAPMFMANVDDMISQAEEVVVNGTFVLEKDADGNIVMEQDADGNLQPKKARDADNNEIYRPQFEGGAVASLENYGTRVMFNLSQIAVEYGENWHDSIDKIVKELVVHEGTHAYFIRDLLNTTERRVLEKFGKREGKVPAIVSEEAHKKGWTWQEYVKKTYPELTEANLVEETSVQILDAIAQGHMELSETAGTIGKIKRQLGNMFGAIAESMDDADLVPVMRVFETMMNPEVMQERKSKKKSSQGLASLQYVERADQDQLQQLKVAVAKGDPDQIQKLAQEILLSRVEDSRTPLQRMQESLISQLRARTEIEGNPDQIVASVINAQAIEDGRVTADSLDAYFRFVDGREPAFKMPPESMMKKTRGGNSSVVWSDQGINLLDRLKKLGVVEEGEYAAGEAVLRTMDGHNTYMKGKGGKLTHVRTMKDWTQMIEYTGIQQLTKKYLDKRLAMRKSFDRALNKEVKDYKTTLSRLANNSAIAAWTFADNAMKFVTIVMESGPVQYINGGFKEGDAYVVDPKKVERDPDTGEITAGWKLDEEGNKIKHKGLKYIMRPILEMGDAAQELAVGYMAALRVLDVNAIYEKRTQELNDATTPREIIKAQEAFDLAKDAYQRTNPTNKEGKLFLGLDDAREVKREVEESNSEEMRRIVTFSEEHASFNFQQIEFAYSTGILSRTAATYMQSYTHVPFYRDQGWQNTDPMENRKNASVEQEFRKKQDGDPVLRGSPLLDKAIQGSFKPINKDLLANLESNAQAIVRDAMHNVAVTRTMRDEVANGTAVEIVEATAEDYQMRNFYRSELKKMKKDGVLKEDRRRIDLQSLLDAKEKHINTLTKNADKLFKELVENGFSDIIVRAKGISTELKLEGVVDENGKPVIDPNTKIQQTKAVPTEIAEHGVPKAYLVMDPELSQSIMEIGFSPQQAIEEFFGKTIGIKSEWVNKGLAKLLVGSSRLLRETVTRSPPFALKNLIRDSMQAGVIYGGEGMGLKVFLNAWKYAMPEIFTGLKTRELAQQHGLGIAVDAQPDDYKNMSYDSSIPIMGSAWNAMGSWSQKLEVATRLAVYDHTMAKTNGNAAESLYQAIELLNYGRRGSSRMFGVMAAMAPFMNGRIQGLNVMWRNHTGALDSPGLFLEDGQKINQTKQRFIRAGQAASRGGLIMLGTMLYFLMVRDEEEYKNTRDDLKDDWWMIPLGHGKDGKPRPSFKIPIPFEVGLFYKIIPEQMMRWATEQEHDFGDVKTSLKRQAKASLFFDLRPQLIRPVIDAMTNRDSFQKDAIVPQWMEDTVAASEHYNPYTNMVTRVLGDKLSKIPMVNKLDFLTSPMKLEYMIRQYMGTIGGYGMLLADRVTREVMDENIVGTQADFGSFSQPISARTFANLPVIGDLFTDPAKGGGYQEDLYEMQEKLDKLVTTLGQIDENRGPQASRDFEKEHPEMFRNKRRLQYFDRRMKHYREERDRLFNRTDLSDEDKRNHLFRMFETRDDMLEEVVDLMADIRKDRSFLDQVIGEDR